ncbi:16S rRNA (guanine(966)-N(2))-methyltransferase RsmD [Magnetospirillum moscoviense]|uniref:16S rRNA (Guanine(966)-N(2))-methyltransferase RsmD n=1 Tax=Magnetospirillum moscoviense TaxID=1437059 RepID=A0A178MBH9_9PROT|nr:16S rRNA (guanine(966)-N(2))-methyltransferase RsmD [Magnetospirillum moscoviense]OAN45923.1 16S rRNA (guanine(966)-N(2))-methyltransferase RsmD [Magnetospirillum moscoviense]
MRIVGGVHKGRRLAAPSGRDTRPTADRAREALFNILAHSAHVELDGARVVDCFAGSGGLGLEALSRGAAHVTLVEQAHAALTALKANVETLREGQRATIVKANACRLPPAPQSCTLALLDPPYHLNLAAPCLASLAATGWLAPDALCVVEVAADEDFTPPAGFSELERRTYGAAKFVFLKVTPPAP